MLRYHARSVGSRTTESARATRGSTTQYGTDALHGFCTFLLLFLMARYRTAVKACCDHKSRQYAVSLCGATFRDTLCAPRASFPQNISSQPTRCMSQTLQATCFAPIPKRSSDLNSVRAQQTFVAKVTVCRHVVSNRHSFPVKTIALYSSYTVGSQKHQACSSRIFQFFCLIFCFLSFSNLFSLPTALIGSDILGIVSTNSSSSHCMHHIPVRLPIASISTCSICRFPSMSDIHLPVEQTRLTESRSTYKIELDLSALFSNF